MIVLGLTGSIATGKSTVASMFAEAGVPVFSADAAVHELYSGEVAAALAELLPGAVADGRVDRNKVAELLAGNPSLFPKVEAILHPLVRDRAGEFIDTERAAGRELVVLEVPLLFESAYAYPVNRVAVTVVDAAELRHRVLVRPGMTEERLEAILARQMSQDDKRARADFVIDTSHSLEAVRNQVDDIIEACLAEARS